jgi:CheY-like chemotaxis protein
MQLKGKRIFVIEDDPTNLAIIATMLRRAGASVPFDTWGTGAINSLKVSMPIDLILLDLALPRGVSGYNIYNDIQAVPELKDIPVVVVTAADPSIEMPKARQKGLNGFISKPLFYRTFGNSISAILDGQQVWGELE